jgi:Ca-activated chloride channel family protein
MKTSKLLYGSLFILVITPIVAKLSPVAASLIKSSTHASSPNIINRIMPGRIVQNNLTPNTPTKDSPVGGLFVQNQDGKQLAFPLQNTKVQAKIAGNLTRVEVTQTFTNPFNDPLEAVYIFPLPDEAAVDDMEILIGDRLIKGLIKKREEAEKIYEQAKAEGKTAGLLSQERDNIFTQALANIRPGEEIKVIIRYTESLKYLHGKDQATGEYEFVFPMVVGPRYIPGNMIPGGNTDQVPDANRINPPVMRPGTRSGHDIQVSVEIEAGVNVKNVRSPSHQINTTNQGNIVKVDLAPGDNIPNKDLILRYQVAGEQTEASVLTQADDRGGHFALYFIPAVQYDAKEIVPKDVVFLMDTSGSQQGEPLLKSQELMREFINQLNPDDTFTIIDFANTAQTLSSQPLPNTAANRQKAINYVNQLDANGGTELLNGIKAVLNFPPAPAGRLRSVVLLTDGYIGNENEVIAEVQRNLKPGNRLYSFGVGSSVNRFLIDRIAEVGRGTSHVIRQDEPSDTVIENFIAEINKPVLTNIQVQWQGTGPKPEIYPSAIPDLFARQPLVLFGKKADGSSGNLLITGNLANGQIYEKTLPVNFSSFAMRNPEISSNSSNDVGNQAIAQLWGRFRIKDLSNQMFGMETKTGVDAITQTALDYRLLSAYTAFVAVSEEVRVNPDGTKIRVEVPVELPEGVSYTGIFGDTDDSINQESFSNLGAMPQMARSGGYHPKRLNVTPAAPPPPVPQKLTESAEPSVSVGQIQIISATNLTADVIASLTQYLQGLIISEKVKGEVTWVINLQNGVVRQIILDDDLSTITDEKLLDRIKRAIMGWQFPQSVNGEVVLKLKVES